MATWVLYGLPIQNAKPTNNWNSLNPSKKNVADAKKPM
jgi:hypothetical protein